MKRLSLYLFLIFFTLQTPSQADDIRDFQIEGMSVGDSLLDYFSESEIQKYFYPKSKKFARTYHEINDGIYEGVRIHYKTKDKKFIIHALSGMISYANNVEACYTKEKEIIKELESQFPSARKKAFGTLIHKSDPTGESIYTLTAFYFDNGAITLECTDWSKSITSKRGWDDYLGVMIDSNEFVDWLRDEAR